MKSKALGCFVTVLVLALFASVMVNVFYVAPAIRHEMGGSWGDGTHRRHAAPADDFEYQQVERGGRGVKDRVAQIDLEGIITGEELGLGSMVTHLKQALKQAVEDPFVKAIVLRIDSPGGEVTASDVMYNAVKEASAKKPVIAFMDTVAASGGYYISCGATTVVANQTSITGSIGVIMQGIGYQGLMEKAGVEMRTFKSGALKDAGAGSRPMTDAERAYLQTLVMQNYDRFVQVVSDARKLPVDELKSGLADGRIFLAPEAKEKKLIDEVGYIEKAYELARAAAKSPEAEIVRFMRPPSLRGLLGFGGQAATPVSRAASPADDRKIQIEVPGLRPTLKPGVAYFLPGAWY